MTELVQLVQTLACSLILSMIDYCNAVLHGALTRTIQKTAANSEKCSLDCARDVEVVPHQAVTAPAALVASPAADHIQAGSSDVQSSDHVHSGLPTLPNCRTCLQQNVTCHLAAGPTFHENCFQHHLSSTQYHTQFSSVILCFKSRLKTVLFSQTFTEH